MTAFQDRITQHSVGPAGGALLERTMNLDLVSLAVEGSEFSVLKGVDFEAVDIAR